MGKPLTWVVHETYMDDFDKTYVQARVWRAFSGKQRIAEVTVHYGDSNSANSVRGTIDHAHVSGKFKKHWSGRGYNWNPAHPWVPALANDKEPRDWVDGRWAKWLAKAGL